MRKHLSNYNWIQSSQLHNDTLRPVYEDIASDTLYIQVSPKTITRLQRVSIILSNIGLVNTLDASIVLGLFGNFYDSPPACTIITFRARKRTAYPHEFVQADVDSIGRKLDASQLPNLLRCLTYRGLFTDVAEATHEGHDLIPSVATALWKHHLSNIKSHLSKDPTTILHHYNKMKNVSYETQSLSWQESGLIPSREIRNTTTLNLFRIYARYG
jgi:hypothetical protein